MLNLPSADVFRMKNHLLLCVQQGEVAVIQNFCFFNPTSQLGQCFNEIANIPNANRFSPLVENGFVAREIRAAKDINDSVKSLSLPNGGNSFSCGVENSPHRARGVLPLDVCAYANEFISAFNKDRSGPSHQIVDLIHQAKPVRHCLFA